MRRETALVAGFVGFVVASAALVWAFALPNLVPVHVPPIVSATIATGPSRQAASLSDAQVAALNRWLAGQSHAWGPLSSTPPSSGDAVLALHPASGPDYTLTVWLGLSAGDWDDAAVLQRHDAPKPRYGVFSDASFAGLRKIVQPDALPHADLP